MRKVQLVGFAIVLFAMAVIAGCPKPMDTSKATDPTTKTDDGEKHAHGAGPHKGVVADFGKYHVEFCVDHDKKEATVYVLKGDEKTPAPVKTDKLLLSIKEPQFQVDLKARPQEGDKDKGSSRFVATHDKFGKEQEFEGTISGEVDGKQYVVEFKEEPEKKK